MGALYPFSLRDKLDRVTEASPWYSDASPFGGSIIPMEMTSALFSYQGHSGFSAGGPSVGLFADQEIRLLDGPLSSSRRTESARTRTRAFRPGAVKPCAEMLLNIATLKDSYANYAQAFEALYGPWVFRTGIEASAAFQSPDAKRRLSVAGQLSAYPGTLLHPLGIAGCRFGTDPDDMVDEQDSRIRQIEGGAIRGSIGGSVVRFLGIPYAAPPQRFELPQPPAGWNGVRDMDDPGPAAPHRIRLFPAIDLSPLVMHERLAVQPRGPSRRGAQGRGGAGENGRGHGEPG